MASSQKPNPTAIRIKLAQAMVEDTACRVPGVTKGLYKLGDLAKFERIDVNSIPMLFPSRTNPSYKPKTDPTIAKTDAEFAARLKKVAPTIASFDFRKHGVCLAGGSVSALVMDTDGDIMDVTNCYGNAYDDYDLFLVGLKDDASCCNVINAFAAHLYAWISAAGDDNAESDDDSKDNVGSKKAKSTLWVARTENCVTFHVTNPSNIVYDGLTVQFILRNYSTVAEIIHGFDMGSSAFLWDGEHIHMTAMGKLAAEHGVNVLNLKARRPSYEHRLVKYFNRGYEIVLPKLDASSYVAHGRLPYLAHSNHTKATVHGLGVGVEVGYLVATRPDFGINGRPPKKAFAPSAGTALVALTKIAAGSGATAAEPAEPTSNYGFGNIPYGVPSAIEGRNMYYMLATKINTACLVASAEWTPQLNIFEMQPRVEAAQLEKTVAQMFTTGQVDPQKLMSIVGADAAASLTLEMMIGGGITGQWLAQMKRCCAERCVAINEAAKIPFKIMGVEDKTALSGPFPRALVSEADWYGPAMFGNLEASLTLAPKQ